MKKTYFRYLLASIKNDLVRLSTITAIVALGMSFLVGLLSTTPDLYASMDAYYDETNFNDIFIKSTIGFSNDTPDYIMENISDVSNATLATESDQFITMNNRRVYAHIVYEDLTANDMNTLEVLIGRLPTNASECVLLETNDSLVDYNLGDKIIVDDNEVTIVGTVTDPTFITYQIETSLVTGNALEAIVYFNSKHFDDLIYTTLYINFANTAKMNSFGDEYAEFIEEKKGEIENISQLLIDLRIAEIRSSYYDQVYQTVYQAAYDATLIEVQEYLANLGLSADMAPIIMEIVINSDSFLEEVNNATNEALDSVIEELSPSWYILDRDSVSSAYVFKTDASKVNTIALIFPPFFFAIAMLVTLSSMSRIISKDRQVIGTFKALGYSKRSISTKYIVYGLMSSLFGTIAGVVIGLFLFPYIFMTIYQTIYHITIFTYVFTSTYVFGFGLLMIGLISLVILLTILGTLRESSVSLMSGQKAPKPGKKILLERIKPLWKHMSFKYKSTFRNIFRFKKNLLMMIIGIGGCSGMLLAGFGIQDAFDTLVDVQFGGIMKYDGIVTLTENGLDPTLIFEENDPIAYKAIINDRGTMSKNESYSVQIIASDSGISEFIGIYDVNNHQEITLNDYTVVITEQLATDFGIDVNETITLNTDYGTTSIKVTNIAENYVNNYVYMGAGAYYSYFGKNVADAYNAFIIKATSTDEVLVETAFDKLISSEYVASFLTSTSTKDAYNAIVSNLSSIVLVVIVLSGALAAIVIYNLTDININERIREIATLRVLGYRRSEVLMYILREIFIMAIIGVLVGICVGLFLNWFILININSIGLIFSSSIDWTSYIYTILLSIAFVVLVSLCFYPKIRRINMAESLKSVE